MSDNDLTLRIAKAICAAWDAPWAEVPDDKSHWYVLVRDAGPKMRDVNLPYKGDYLAMAEAAIKVLQSAVVEAVEAIQATKEQ
jgi:hypothetical protein